MTNKENLMNTQEEERGPLWYATNLVFEYIDSRNELSGAWPWPDYEVYVVFYTHTLGNWKATLATSLTQGFYFEVTYNKDSDQIYFDSYVKIANITYEMEDVKKNVFVPKVYIEVNKVEENPNGTS